MSSPSIHRTPSTPYRPRSALSGPAPSLSPANPAYTAKELTFQLKDSGAKALVTQRQCLNVALEAAKNAGIPESRIILIGDERDGGGKDRLKHFCSIRSTSYTGRYARARVHP